MELINGDCLEVMKDLSDNSVDFLFCDLPYGQTSCKWDCLIDLDLFWKQVNRVCKQDAVMAFTCRVKFGNTLINSNPKCFRYDLVWVKSAACGFLNAKKMPMKKHEMVYIFYRKLAKVYTENIALHHTHKFLKETENKKEENIVVETRDIEGLYGEEKDKIRFKVNGKLRDSEPRYNPPLPNSVIKEENVVVETNHNTLYGNIDIPNCEKRKNGESRYDPPLPNSVIKEELCNYDVNKNAYGGGKEGRIKISKNKEDHQQKYNPPLPNSVIKEENVVYDQEHKSDLYGEKTKRDDIHKTRYNPPLPNTILEIKSEKGKHATQKPVPLMEYLIKYFTREGETVLDPTMGSGGTGIACKNLNRKFIGIEMDKDIFDVAVERNK